MISAPLYGFFVNLADPLAQQETSYLPRARSAVSRILATLQNSRFENYLLVGHLVSIGFDGSALIARAAQ